MTENKFEVNERGLAWRGLRAALVGLSMGAAMPALAADGEALFQQKLCVTCHGAEGRAPITGTYPKLAGQNKDYLIQQFNDIQSGARANGQAAAMKGIVSGVSAAEIEAIADYLSKLE